VCVPFYPHDASPRAPRSFGRSPRPRVGAAGREAAPPVEGRGEWSGGSAITLSLALCGVPRAVQQTDLVATRAVGVELHCRWRCATHRPPAVRQVRDCERRWFADTLDAAREGCIESMQSVAEMYAGGWGIPPSVSAATYRSRDWRGRWQRLTSKPAPSPDPRRQPRPPSGACRRRRRAVHFCWMSMTAPLQWIPFPLAPRATRRSVAHAPDAARDVRCINALYSHTPMAFCPDVAFLTI